MQDIIDIKAFGLFQALFTFLRGNNKTRAFDRYLHLSLDYILILSFSSSSSSFHVKVFLFWASSSNHCLTVLDLGADVEQPFDCLIVQNRQAMQSMRRSMDWTLENNGQHGRWFVLLRQLTGRRGNDNPSVQARAETSDIGAEAFKPKPGYSWQGHSGEVSVSTLHWWSAQCAARTLLLSDILMSCCAASTNGWFEALCICTRWTGDRLVEQISTLHGTACWRQCGSIATKLSRLDACEDGKVVR